MSGKMKKVFKKRLNVLRTRKTYSGEASPYWDFMGKHMIVEPDISEEDNIFLSQVTDQMQFQLEVVREGMELLTIKEREVIELYGFENVPLSQVAEIMKVTEGTVKSLLARAKEKMQRLYQRKRMELKLLKDKDL